MNVLFLCIRYRYGHAEIYSGLSISLDDKYAKAYFIRARAKASLDKIEGALQGVL